MIKFLKQLFCWHRWKVVNTARFEVMRGNGTIEGEVSLTQCVCEKCGVGCVEQHDRIHYKK